MTPERWARLTKIFDAAVDQPPARRPAFLEAACGDDHGLRREIERLLDSHEHAGDFGTTPAFRFESAGAASPPIDATLDAGVRLGRYQIVELIGSGGMGAVYRATDPQLGRDVGIKVLRHRGEVSPEALQRFAREARAAGALQHPNILAVYDIGESDGIPYVVSELLSGETLRARLQRGALPLAEATAVALQIVSGLAAAHDKGIVHRDLKPDNLFITTDGVVKILDFGLARHLVDDADEDDGGIVMGTAGYMAPEQVRGEEAGARADLFSFGAVLCEMLTGRRAFAGDSVVDTMEAVATADPADIDALPAPIAAIVRRCLAKNPAGRFASADDVRAALASIGRFAQVRTWRLGYAAYAAAASLLVAAAIAAPLIVKRPEAGPRPGATGRPALAVMPFDDRSGDPNSAWLSNGIPSMLVTSLAQTPGLDVIGEERLEASFRELRRLPADRSARADAARRAGAGALLTGTLFMAGSEIRLDVQVQDVDTGRVVAARTEQGADLFAIVDALATHIRGALDVANRPSGRPLRDVTTTSLEAYALYAKGQQARHNNRWRDARTLFDEALRIDPAFTLARAQLVTMLDRLGEKSAAIEARRIVASQLDRLPERQRLLAEAVQEYDTNPARAIGLLERLIDRYPDEEEGYDALVHAYTHGGDPAYVSKTLVFMDRWARAIPGPGSGHFHNHYGYAYIDRRLFTEAEREFRAYIRVSPDEANGYDSLGELFLMTGRPAMAIEYYDRALMLNPLFAWSHFGRAYALAVQGRYDAAFTDVATLHELVMRGIMPAAVVHLFDAILSSRVGNYSRVDEQLRAAQQSVRALDDAGGLADAELVAATLALERGQHARAIRAADRAIDASLRASVDIVRTRRSAFAHLIAGIAAAQAGHLDEARRRLEAQRKLDAGSDPVQVSWQNALSGEMALARGQLEEAETAFAAAEYQVGSSFAIYPTLVVLANNLPFRDGAARTAVARGDVARAIEVYRRLNQSGVTSKWSSVFEPRYALAAAQLAQRAGDLTVSRTEQARFAEAWKGSEQAGTRR
jgi:tetratricopeptide (TPR) repeat protein